ncbi:alpha/beta fold hydrolase [Streptomyces sp. NPDC000880]
MSFVSVEDNVNLHYRVAGDGPTLLFHPGFSNTLDLWNWLVLRLSPTHRCVTFDPRGHGASDKPDSAYDLAELAGDVVGLAERLGLTDVTLVGHSLGGAVSLKAVLDHDSAGRISRLALIDPALPTFLRAEGEEFGVPPDVYEQMRTDIVSSWVPTQLETAKIFFHRTDPATARWIFEQTLAMPVHIAARYFAQLPSIDFRDRLTEITLPVLLLWGAHDRLTDPRWTEWFRARDLPGWRVEILEQSGHGAMVDESARMAESLREFTG